jgi:phosphatidylserine/phosphatidylglycerophosphate/cardiolipin synthase-like enzyme
MVQRSKYQVYLLDAGLRMKMRRFSPVLALFLILGAFVAFQFFESRDRQQVESLGAEVPQSVEVFFSTPWDPASATLRGGPDAQLAAAIDAARYSVDVAIYNLDLWSLRDALIKAHQRGVTVRLVVESDHAEEPEIEALASSGIPVHEDQRDSLMHHKFTVIDGFEVWTGSMNYSLNGAYRHDNNLLRMRSAEVGANYTREFEEMFHEDRFGGLSRADTPFPQSTLDGHEVRVFFSPDDSVASHLVDVLNEAQDSIDMLAFTLTSDPIAEALLQAAEGGVRVRVVVERDQAGNAGSDVDRLKQAGVDLRLDGNPNRMHHKVIVVDKSLVATGSYNFSRSAEDFNDENMIIIYSEALAADYLVEFNRIYTLALREATGED